MANVIGFMRIELMSGDGIEFLNEEALQLKNEIYEKWSTGEKTTFNNNEIYDIHYNFVTEK